jgi:hypothetical protein
MSVPSEKVMLKASNIFSCSVCVKRDELSDRWKSYRSGETKDQFMSRRIADAVIVGVLWTHSRVELPGHIGQRSQDRVRSAAAYLK